MDISKLTLKQFQKIVKSTIAVMESRNSHPNTAHLHTTASWLMQETDEEVFELLKKGSGGEYMEAIVQMEEPVESNPKATKSREKEASSNEKSL